MVENKRNIEDLQIDKVLMNYLSADNKNKEHRLRENITSSLGVLKDLQNLIASDHIYETKLYKYYHHSYKVYHLQEYTLNVVDALKELLDLPLNENFMRQIELGTGKEYTPGLKVDWFEETVHITNAFLHAKYMLEMVLKYGAIGEDGSVPSFTHGWAAVLCLYIIR